MITAKTITDEQIHALNKDPRSSLTTKAWCVAALRLVYGDSRRQLRERLKARGRCAEILNALTEAK